MKIVATDKDMWTFPRDNTILIITTNLVFYRKQGTKALVMGAGLAKQALLKYPNLDLKVFPKYMEHGVAFTNGQSKWKKLVHLMREENLIIFPTKNHYREFSSLTLIKEGLEELRVMFLSEELLRGKDVFLPRLGCNLGGLNWYSDVGPLVKKIVATDTNNFLIRNLIINKN